MIFNIAQQAHPNLIQAKSGSSGLLIRPHGVPVQAMPPLTQLLNIINSGMTPDAAEGGETDGVKKEANGHPSNAQWIPKMMNSH